MNRDQWRHAHRSARLGRRRDAGSLVFDHELGPGLLSARSGVRRNVALAFTALALAAAILALWRMAPGDQRGQTLAVSVPAASSPAAADGPTPLPS